MNRIFVAILLVMMPLSAQAEEVWLYTVNLDGVPKAGVTLTIENGETPGKTVTTDPYGRAKVDIGASANSAKLKITSSGIVREAASFSWTDRNRLNAGLIIPLWTFRDLKSLSTKVAVSSSESETSSSVDRVGSTFVAELSDKDGMVRLTSHSMPHDLPNCAPVTPKPPCCGPVYYAVAFRTASDAGEEAIVLAKTCGSLAHVKRWLEEYVPNVPQATMPTLAKDIHERLEPGDEVPAEFDDQMAELDRKIARVNCRCASPLPQPVTTAYPFYSYRAPQNGLGPVAIPQPYLRTW